LNWLRVKFRLRGWIASAWQSDTIFGHLCWGMRYMRGEDKLRDFLGLYDAGKPPLLVSNGFPGDFLPQPITAPPTIDRNLMPNLQREQFRQHKQAKGNKWLTADEFTCVLSGEIVTLSAQSRPEDEKRVTLKNQLNRLTCTTGEGGALYNFEEYYWPEVTIYLKVSDDFTDMAKQLLQYVADTGYGKRKSIGYGQIESMSFEPFNGFKQPKKPNGFVTLSNFVPSANDPTKGSWNVIVKYGKMGEEWASEDHVFKKPLLMLEAGSTFLDSSCRDYYGCLVRNLNPTYSQAIQYAFALPVPMVIHGQDNTSKHRSK
jgi:CRISPR-associated protein Csm4